MSITSIPLSKLTHSPSNVRKIGAKSVDDLAASIEANGLLQNLTVIEGAKGKFAVIAGGRRLTALQKLAKEQKIAKDFPVPCSIRSADAHTGPCRPGDSTFRSQTDGSGRSRSRPWRTRSSRRPRSRC